VNLALKKLASLILLTPWAFAKHTENAIKANTNKDFTDFIFFLIYNYTNGLK